MSLLNRLGRLFRADFNAVLDQLEEPTLVLKEAIREMEAALAADQRRAAALAREHDSELARQREMNHEDARCEAELELCLAADDEALARSVIRRQLVLANRLRGSERRTLALADALQEIERGCASAERQLDDFRQRAVLLEAAPPADHARPLDATLGVTDEAVSIALLRARKLRGASCG